MPPFLPTLLALDAKATPGDWHIGQPTPMRPTHTLYNKPFGLGDVAEVYGEADAAFIAFARNSAARLAAVVEAAGAVVASWYGNPGDSPSPDEAHAALRAALLALDEVKS